MSLLRALLLTASGLIAANGEGQCDQNPQGNLAVSFLMVSATKERGASSKAGLKSNQAELKNTVEQHTSFDDYVRSSGRSYVPGTEEYEMRRARYEQHVALVQKHNSQPGVRWKGAVNSLADWTDAELASLRGYKRLGSQSGSAEAAERLSLQQSSALRGQSAWSLPEEFTWQGRLAATREVQDQGSCGSCWAFAASTALRAHSELFQRDTHISVQQLVSCVPNPSHCGGAGGCDGATVELAWDYLMQRGGVLDGSWAYEAMTQDCPSHLSLSKPSLLPQPFNSTFLTEGGAQAGILSSNMNHEGESKKAMSAAQLNLIGWMKLPENKIDTLFQALYTRGPVAISLSAGFQWNIYSSGILDACRRDTVVDHAVVLVGYGAEDGLGYWHIQNSWGRSWGENGFVRLARNTNHALEEAYCGIDNQPLVGSGCEGGPAEVQVCGSCGILSDMVVPEFVLGPDGWWASHPSL